MTTYLYFYSQIILLLSRFVNIVSVQGETTSFPTGLVAGPVYNVMIKFPYWSTGQLMTESATGDNGAVFTSVHNPYNSSKTLYYVHFFNDEYSASTFVAIETSTSSKWLMHHGKSTRPQSPVQFKIDSSKIVTCDDRRLFHCSNPMYCAHDGIIATVPGTDLYLNGCGPDGGLVFHEEPSYFMFIPSRVIKPSSSRGDLRLGESLALPDKILNSSTTSDAARQG